MKNYNYEYYVEGMHCAACELVIEKKLSKYKGVKKVDAILAKEKVYIELEQGLNGEKIRRALSKLIEKDGYTLVQSKATKSLDKNYIAAIFISIIGIFVGFYGITLVYERYTNLNTFSILLIAALIYSTIVFLASQIVRKLNIKKFDSIVLISGGIIGFFILLQKVGLFNLLNSSNLNMPLVFFIGLIASLSSCSAVVGGLILGLSANYEKDTKRNKKYALGLFHISRFVTFFLLGGFLGLVPSLLTWLSQNILKTPYSVDQFQNALLSPEGKFVLGVFIGILLLFMALNLLDVLGKSQIKLPKFIGKTVMKASENTTSKFAPITLGFLTFFLPCGFTQTMQINALATGSFIESAFMMLVFTFGTFPVLFLIGISSSKFVDKDKSKAFFKVAGLIVLFFAIFNLLGALAAIGIIQPIFNI